MSEISPMVERMRIGGSLWSLVGQFEEIGWQNCWFAVADASLRKDSASTGTRAATLPLS